MGLVNRLTSDATLVRRALADTPSAFEALVERYQRKATAIARALGVPASSVDDVVQESLLQAFSGLRNLRSPESFGPWLSLHRPEPVAEGDRGVPAELRCRSPRSAFRCFLRIERRRRPRGPHLERGLEAPRGHAGSHLSLLPRRRVRPEGGARAVDLHLRRQVSAPEGARPPAREPLAGAGRDPEGDGALGPGVEAKGQTARPVADEPKRFGRETLPRRPAASARPDAMDVRREGSWG